MAKSKIRAKSKQFKSSYDDPNKLKDLPSHDNLNKCKYFNVNPSKDHLDKFEESPTEFVTYFLETHREDNVKTVYDVYSILLYAAVVHTRTDLFNHILTQVGNNNILVHTNVTGHSPVSMALLLGNDDIIESIKNYVARYRDLKRRCEPKELENLESALCQAYRRSDVKYVKSLYNDCLRHLYLNSHELIEYIGNLIGENNIHGDKCI